jgi:2-dehydro-3-deoxyphosphogluconate aldolase/(4S)-4-hydroxy-2-oxoglutarate aldolase
VDLGDRYNKLELIRETGVLAILRARSSELLLAAADALQRGGVRVVEVSLTTPGALDVVAAAVQRYGQDLLFGVGTVLDVAAAEAAIQAGAGLIVAPVVDLEVIAFCNRAGIPVIPGCYTPTEMFTAWRSGADMIKLFPASLGGPELIRTLLAPLPQLEIVPVGGVTLQNAAEFIRKGAAALGVGSGLVSQALLDTGDFDEIARRAAAFIAAVKSGRGTTDWRD